MSERDDELLTLLRAELSRRATTTPREGFEMRVHTAVRDLQRPRGGHRLMAAGVALVTVAAVAVGLAAGLRAHQDRGAKPPLPTPSAKSALYVLVEPGGTGVNYSADTIRFVRSDGTLARALPFPGGPDATHQYETVGGDQLFYVVGLERLDSVGIDGVVHHHGLVAESGWGVNSVVVSPDGRHWAWTDWRLEGGGQTTTIHTRLHRSGDNETARILLDQSVQQAHNAGQHVDPALAWTDRGIVLVQQPLGIGGGPFTYGASTHPRVVDEQTGAVRTLDNPQDLAFFDMGADGSYTEVVEPSRVDFVDAHGARRRVIVADPVRLVFGARVAPDGHHVAVAVVESGGDTPDGSFRLRTDLFDMASGRATRVAPEGYLPDAWLPDGSLVLDDEDPAVSTSPAGQAANQVEVIAPGGRVTYIGPGHYIGMAQR